VAHACNPSYLGGRNQEDLGSKPAQRNSFQDPISKNPITKKWAGGVAQGVAPSLNPMTKKKKKKKKKKLFKIILMEEDSIHSVA
jgi:hypothetical protein